MWTSDARRNFILSICTHIYKLYSYYRYNFFKRRGMKSGEVEAMRFESYLDTFTSDKSTTTSNIPFVVLVGRSTICILKETMANQITTSSFHTWTSPFYGLFRTANEAAKLGDDCTNKVFVVSGAYSGLGM